MSKHQSLDGTPGDSLVEGLGLSPLKGHLVPLKTKGEIRASNELINVYITHLPARSANALLTHLRRALPPDPTGPDLQHLRRVIQPAFLPAPAHSHLTTPPPTTSTETPPSPSTETRYLLICPTALLPLPALTALLSTHPPFAPSSPESEEAPFPLTIHTLPVPPLPPTSAPLAAAWSATYWPTAYKHTNPFGPHPSFVDRAAAEVAPDAGRWLALAEEAGRQGVEAGMGVGVGAVVVERRLDGNGRAVGEGEGVVVAGDGRWCGKEREGCGNVMAHAVMRAVGMVGLRRVGLEEESGKEEGPVAGDEGDDGAAARPSRACADPVVDVFATEPRTEVERRVFAEGRLAPGGYLCVDLEIYLSHEPCVMCAMAIVHSRFNRCVFARRMDRSGGLTADGRGVGHGLFWRPAELNWKFLCWEFVEEDGERERERLVVDDGINA